MRVIESLDALDGDVLCESRIRQVHCLSDNNLVLIAYEYVAESVSHYFEWKMAPTPKPEYVTPPADFRLIILEGLHEVGLQSSKVFEAMVSCSTDRCAAFRGSSLTTTSERVSLELWVNAHTIDAQVRLSAKKVKVLSRLATFVEPAKYRDVETGNMVSQIDPFPMSELDEYRQFFKGT